MIFSTSQPDSFALASSASDNIGSSVDAGLGSSAGTGVDSSAGTGIDSSAGTGVGSSTGDSVGGSTHSLSEKEKLDEAYNAAQAELKKAMDDLNFITFKERIRNGAAVLMEIEKKRIEYQCKLLNHSTDFMEYNIKGMEEHYTEHFELELTAHKLLIDAGDTPHVGSWRKNIESPGVLLDDVQKSGLHAVQMSKDIRKSIYDKCKDAIKYAPFPEEMKKTPKLQKQMGYLSVLARVQYELAALEEAKELNAISEEQYKKNKASLNLAELLASKRARWLYREEFNDEEREKCTKNVSLEGDTYYRGPRPKNKKKIITDL